MRISKSLFLILAVIFLHLSVLIWLNETNSYLKVNGDSSTWISLARSSNPIYNNWWPPLYPQLIAPISQSLFLIGFIQTALFLVSCLIIYMIAALANPKATPIFVFIFSILPAHVLLTKVPLADTFFLFFYTIFYYLAIKYLKDSQLKILLLSICFLILATFTKPTTLFLHLLIYPLLIFFSGFNKKTVLVGVLGVVIPTIAYLGWSYHNFKQTGIFSFALVGNFNLLNHNFYHYYPYIQFSTGFDRANFQINPGQEFQAQSGEDLRQYLKTRFIQNYLQLSQPDFQKLSSDQIVKASGTLAIENIMSNLAIILPIHLIESFYIFIPNNWEVFKSLMSDRVLSVLKLISFGLGIMYLLFFCQMLIRFFKTKIRYDIKTISLILTFVNLVYLQLFIGPLAIDDGGRSSFVYLWFLTLLLTLMSEVRIVLVKGKNLRLSQILGESLKK